MEFNLADLWERVAGTVTDREALVAGATRLTYGALDRRANRVAHGLQALGIVAGDHVAIYLRNCPEYIETMLACFKLRAVPVNVNYRYVASELRHVLDDAGAAGVVTEVELQPAVDACGFGGWMLTTGEAYESLAAGQPETAGFGPRSADDHYLLYTGGTTGMPKGVVWRHADIFFATLGGGNPGGPPIARPEEIAQTVLTNRAQRLTPFLPPGDPGPERFVSLALGPLMHASGQWSALGALLGGGTAVIYTRPSMDMHAVLQLVETERVCMLTLVGDASGRPLADVLEANPGRWETGTLRLLGSGGSILSADVKDRLLRALPSVAGISEAVGSSEAPVQGVAISKAGPQTSLAFAVRDNTVVLDDQLRRVTPGSGVVGRLATTGFLPLGYHNDPVKTAETFVEFEGRRWAMPGDMATVEADGTIRLVGRGSLCINTGGEKVYPDEVEAVVKSLPGVRDAIVVGTPDPRLGERVGVVLSAAARVTLADVQAHCRRLLAGYKVPRQLALVDDVNRSPAGKPDYRWARQVLAGG